jgi:hypothetical protein
VKRQALADGEVASGKIATPKTLARIRGLLTPPKTGDYRFALSADDVAVFELSTNDQPFQRREIARVEGNTRPKEWATQPGQMSAPLRLEAGKPLFFEVLVWNNGGAGHVEIAWMPPGEEKFTPVKLTTEAGEQQVLRYRPGPEDADDDELPDTWQQKYGLTGAGRESFADPDGDSSTNFEEYLAGTDPTHADPAVGKLRREVWSDLGWEETMRQRLRFGDSLFPRPVAASTSPGIKPLPTAYPSLQKFRGYLTPPTAGRYRFHLCGQGRVRFMLSPDERVLAKRVVQDGGLTMQGDPVPLDKPGAFPDSEWLSLEAGKRYYFEVYYWIERRPVSIRWEWTKPDGLREPVPATAVEAFAMPSDDTDQDDLPDAWEQEMGLRVSGTETNDFATGDPDHDGLSSGEEYLLRTNPCTADTDRDGVDDGTEIHILGTSPRDKTRPLESGPVIDLFGAKPLTYGWSKANGGGYASFNGQSAPQPDPRQPSLVNQSGCGSAEWSFTTTKEGFHVVRCEFQQLSAVYGDITGRSQWWIDGEPLPEVTTQASNTALQRAIFLTPRLAAGNHTLKVRFRATHQLMPTRIFALEMKRVTDSASPEVARHLLESNRFTRGTGESQTSPACVEAITRLEEMPAWKVAGKLVTAQRSDAWNSWVDVALPDDGQPVSLELSAEKNSVLSTSSVKWVPTDVFNHRTLVVRQGDQLRLAVGAHLNKGTRTLEIAGQPHKLASGECLVWTAAQPGRHQIVGKWQSKEGSETQESVMEVIVAAPFEAKDAGWARVKGVGAWIETPGQGFVIDGGKRVTVSSEVAGRVGLFPQAAGDWVLPVRAGNHGARVGAITVHACKFAMMSRGFYRQWEVSALVENPPPGGKLRFVAENPNAWLPWTSDHGEPDAWQPLTNLNEEGLIFFYAKCLTPKPGAFIHDLHLAMPDGTEW